MSNDQQLAPHQMGPPVEIKASGDNAQTQQANLIVARNAPAFPLVKELIADAMTKKTDMVMLDYTAQAVGMRYQIDGIWHNIAQRDRQSGDAMLAVMKKLADCDPQERRLKQSGEFKVEFKLEKLTCELSSQGVKTGERALLKFAGRKIKLETLAELGMRDKMIEKVKEILNGEEGGMLLLSSMPGDGLTTSWCATLRAADRFMRDFVGLEPDTDPNPFVENVAMTQFNVEGGETPDKLLPSMLLKQPESLVVPDLTNPATIDILCDQVAEGKLVVASVRAKESVEALLRVLAMKPSAEKFANSIRAVIFQRLVRRLCETCKQPYQPNPQLIHKLGLPPGRITNLFRQWQPPPPEQLVDEKGNPIPPPVCPDCGNMGYRGRIAIFELLIINDKIREALIKQSKLEVLRHIAKASKHRTVREEGIAMVARGLTSLTEIQRILK